jgi:hypothetical protein
MDAVSEVSKIFAVITVSRQISGEYVFVRADKAFTKASKADAYVKQLAASLIGPDGKPITQAVTTPQGQAICHTEVGAFELSIED